MGFRMRVIEVSTMLILLYLGTPYQHDLLLAILTLMYTLKYFFGAIITGTVFMFHFQSFFAGIDESDWLLRIELASCDLALLASSF